MPFLRAETNVFPEDLLAPEAGPNEERQWWAIYTKSRQEKSLARELAAWQIPFYLPLISRKHLIAGKPRRSLVPLFAGYLFLHGTPEERIKALTSNRISQTLPVPDQERLWFDLRQVQQLIASNSPLTIEGRLQPGQKVRVKSGALLGIEGVVAERRAKAKLIVEVKFLQQGVSLEVEDFYLEPI